MPETLQEAALGPNSERTQALVDRIAQTAWFDPVDSRDGVRVDSVVRDLCTQFGNSQCGVHQLDRGELSEFLKNYHIAQSPLWDELKQIPDRIRAAADGGGRTELLSNAFNDIPEAVFHRAFDGAFRRFETQGDFVVRFAVTAAMYASSLAVLWELVADVEGMGDNPLLTALAVFEQGHLPLGLFTDTFYIA